MSKFSQETIDELKVNYPNSPLSLITKVYGVFNAYIPDDYEIIGIIDRMQVGACFSAIRLINPHGRKHGVFMTTEVTEIDIQEGIFKTKNSTYKIQKL